MLRPRYVLVLAFALGALPVPAAQAERTTLATLLELQGYSAVPLASHGGSHLSLAATVNGSQGVFVLDTGAGATVLEASGLATFSPDADTVPAHDAIGAGGANLAMRMSEGNRLRIGDYRDDAFTLRYISLSHVNEAFVRRGAGRIEGIIGTDVLERGRAVIDYPNRVLYLRDPGAGPPVPPSSPTETP